MKINCLSIVVHSNFLVEYYRKSSHLEVKMDGWVDGYLDGKVRWLKIRT